MELSEDSSNKESLIKHESEDKWFSWKLFCHYVGPGLLVSIAYLDPGNRKFIFSISLQIENFFIFSLIQNIYF